MAVLSDKGANCSDPLCRQLDFLPFKCSKCNNVYCLDHYKPEDHACKRINVDNRRVYVCRVCLEVVRLIDNEREEDAAIRHNHQCKPHLRKEREERRRGRTCPVAGCKERLTAVSSIHCHHCNRDVCIRHRLREDHKCDVMKEGKISNSFVRRLSANANKSVKTKWRSDDRHADLPGKDKKRGICSIM